MTSRFVAALGVLLVIGPAVHAADFTWLTGEVAAEVTTSPRLPPRAS